MNARGVEQEKAVDGVGGWEVGMVGGWDMGVELG